MKKLLCAVLLLALLLPNAQGEILDTASDFDQEEMPQQIELIYKTKGIYQIAGMNRLVELGPDMVIQATQSRVEQWNAALDAMSPRLPVYLYLAEDARTKYPALTFPEDSILYTYLKENLHADACDHLKYTTLEQYCSYFYSTDQHWNFRGSYQAYTDIVRMILGENEPLLTPTGIQVLPALYNGSRAKHIKESLSEQRFAFYLFDSFPVYKSIINGKTMRYGNRAKYEKGVFSTKVYANHYGAYYGGDYGLIVFERKDYKASDKENLLLIGDSFSNAVKPMLTQHFKRVVSVDLRHYQYETKKSFSLSRVIKEYEIDRVLFLGSYTLYAWSNFKGIKP